MLTLWVILITFGILFIFGLPLAALLSNKEEKEGELWLVAPFLGLSLVILILQNLIYLDIPIKKATPALWIGAAALWAWMGSRGAFSGLFRGFPSGMLACALGAYLIQAMGLLAAGADAYVGRAWHDHLNYTAIAQFLTDYTFRLSIPEVHGQPYLYIALVKKFDRIGPMIFQGFVATSAFSSAKSAFGPSILLAPFLVVLAVYGISRKLLFPQKWALLAAFWAGILPALAMVHLESFFSHVLAIPFLLLWPLVLADASRRPHWTNLLKIALLMAAGSTLYTEFYILFVGTGFLVFGYTALRERRGILLLWFPMVVIAALFLNPGFAPGILALSKRAAVKSTLVGIYPWAQTAEGFNRLWLGDLSTRMAPGLMKMAGVVSLVWFFIVFLSLGNAFLRQRPAIVLALLALAALPLGPAIGGHQYDYQFYKILLSVSPLIPLGMGLAISGVGLFSLSKGLLHFFLKGVGILMLLLSIAGTADMALRAGTGRTLEKIGRGGAHKLLDPATLEIQQRLSGIRGQDLLLLWTDDFYEGGYMNGWLAYMARNNRVWATNPILSDLNLKDVPAQKPLPDSLPTEAYFLIPSGLAKSIVGPSVEQKWSEGPYFFGHFSGKNWAALTDIQNPNGWEKAGGEDFFWVGKGDTVLIALAGRDGEVILESKIFPGPSLPQTAVRNFLLFTDTGYEEKRCMDTREGVFRAVIPVSAGLTRIMIRSLDPPSVQLSSDPRPMLFQLRGVRLLEFR